MGLPNRTPTLEAQFFPLLLQGHLKIRFICSYLYVFNLMLFTCSILF
jgi:hypothetical protein